MTAPLIAVTGSVAFDHIMSFPGRFQEHILADKLHVLNVSFLVQDLARRRGGCAANIAYAMALLGLRPSIVAAVGADFGDYRDWLGAQGIDTARVREHEDLLTASCFITTDRDNNQITGFYPGAMARAADLRLEPLCGAERPALVTISPNDPEAMRAYPAECRRLGLPFLYDPGQQVIALSGAELLDGVSGAQVVICNDYELAVILEKTGLALPSVLTLCSALVVTLGAKGSVVHARGQEPVSVGVARVERVVDPTGAGDAYRGGFVRGLVSGADLRTCARLGALVAAYCVEVQGTTTYGFTRDAFAARYAEAFGERLELAD